MYCSGEAFSPEWEVGHSSAFLGSAVMQSCLGVREARICRRKAFLNGAGILSSLQRLLCLLSEAHQSDKSDSCAILVF